MIDRARIDALIVRLGRMIPADVSFCMHGNSGYIADLEVLRDRGTNANYQTVQAGWPYNSPEDLIAAVEQRLSEQEKGMSEFDRRLESGAVPITPVVSTPPDVAGPELRKAMALERLAAAFERLVTLAEKQDG